jgi:hypothetical protein
MLSETLWAGSDSIMLRQQCSSALLLCTATSYYVQERMIFARDGEGAWGVIPRATSSGKCRTGCWAATLRGVMDVA